MAYSHTLVEGSVSRVFYVDEGTRTPMADDRLTGTDPSTGKKLTFVSRGEAWLGSEDTPPPVDGIKLEFAKKLVK